MTNIEVKELSKKYESLPFDETKQVSKIGEMFMKAKVERLKNNDFASGRDRDSTKEFVNYYNEVVGSDLTAKEDLQFPGNTALYTTVVADMVDQKLRPTLVAENLIKTVRINPTGTSALKIPVNALLTATDLPDSGNVAFPSNDYGAKTIDITWKYSSQKLAYQLITQSNIDIVSDQLGLMGYALARKIDTDIIAEFVTSTPALGTNNNYTAFGVGNTLTYARLVKGMTDHMALNANPSSVLMGPASLNNLLTDTDVINAMGFNSVQAGTTFPMVVNILGIRVVVSNQVGANDVFLIDTERCGYFVEASGVEMFDGRVSGSVAQEFIAVKLYGVGVVQPETVFRLKENTAA